MSNRYNVITREETDGSVSVMLVGQDYDHMLASFALYPADDYGALAAQNYASGVRALLRYLYLYDPTL